MLILIIDQDVNDRMVVSVYLHCCRVKDQIDVAGHPRFRHFHMLWRLHVVQCDCS